MEKPIKRIERIGKGEEIVVNMIQEDLQVMFDKWMLLCDDHKRAVQAFQEDKNEDTAKVKEKTEAEWIKTGLDFWLAIRERYGYWSKNIGIRDGYALVYSKTDKKHEAFKNFMREIGLDIDNLPPGSGGIIGGGKFEVE